LSWRPKVQPVTLRIAGNVSPHFFSGSRTCVVPAGASFMATVQVLSRSAFDSSQAPTMALTASLGAGVWAAAGASPAASRRTVIARMRKRAAMTRRYHFGCDRS
jgi:hypothetical protein